MEDFRMALVAIAHDPNFGRPGMTRRNPITWAGTTTSVAVPAHIVPLPLDAEAIDGADHRLE